MRISAITPTQVWAASSRSLTNIGSGALAQTSTLSTSLAANTTVNLTPSAGTVGVITIAVKTGAAPTAAIFISMRDTVPVTYNVSTTAIASNAVASFNGVNTPSVGYQVFNQDAAVAGSYEVAAWVFTI